MKKRFIPVLAMLSLGILGAEVKPVISIDFEDGFDAKTPNGKIPAKTDGNPRLVPGKFGKALESGPGTGYLEYPHRNLINGKSGSVEMWIKRVGWKPDDNEFHVFFETLDGKGWLVFYKFSAGSKMFMLSGFNRSGQFTFGPYATGYNHRDRFAGHKSPQEWGDDWAHFVGVWSEEGNTVYLNGVPGKLHPSKEFHNPAEIDVGSTIRIGDHPWPVVQRKSASLIDNVKLYDRALTENEVRGLYFKSIYPSGIPLDPKLMRLSFSGDLEKKQIDVDIHTGGAELSPGSVTVKAAIVPEKAVPSAWQNFRCVSPVDIQGVLPLPSKPGKYEIAVQIRDRSGKAEFRSPLVIPDFSWYGSKLGLERKVLEPWTPLEVRGNTILCWGREYRFGNSVLPEQIITRGKAVLARPVQVKAAINGIPVQWTRQKVRTVSADSVGAKLEGEMTGIAGKQEVKLKTEVEIEYDGFALIRLSSDKPEQFTSFSLNIPVRKENALYHHRYSTLRQGCAGNVPPGTGTVDQSAFLPFAWVGDNDRGLFWCCESQQFWPDGNAPDAYAEVRDADSVSMRFRLLREGQKFSPDWKYEFALQATPVKPLPKNWRKTRIISWERNDMRTWPGITAAYFNWGANNVASTFGYPESSDPAAVKEQVRATRAKGIKLLPYLNLSCQPTVCPEWAFFGKKWRMGYLDHDPVDIDRRHAYAAVSVGDKDYSDFVIWKLDKYMRELDLDGQYHDNTFPYQSALPNTGLGFVRDGKRYPSFNIFATRKLLQRNRAMLQAYRKDAFTLAHMSSKIWIPILAYEDAICDGEHFRGRIKDCYPELLPMDMFRAEYMGRQWGLIPVMMSELSPAEAKKTEPTRGLVTLLLLHDTKLWAKNALNNRDVVVNAQKALDKFGYVDAEFIGYFDETPPAATDHKDVYVSAYRKEDKSVLLIVGNVSRQAADVEIRIDFKRLGITPLKLMDWPSGQELRHQDGKFRLRVDGQGYRLIRIEHFNAPETNLWG
ncbi:MAG: hypothetical protein BWY31_04377 [Lentisphaerae bacterium ADurb.Bin242]|nr:MAG: hypothetical protein BWY31_04377 [Lentisphaerae bacterium ADurb.Bin242]